MPRYIAWIPTNLGELQLHYIQERCDGQPQSQIVDFSDTVSRYQKREEGVFRFEYDLHQSKETDTLVTFCITVYSAKTDKPLFCVKDGLVKTNGKITFSIPETTETCDVCADDRNCFNPNDNAHENIPNSIFTFIKQKIHTDLHHKEKVNNLIPVLQIESETDSNWKQQTVQCLNAKIKGLEHDAKRLHKDGQTIERYDKIHSLYLDAQGIDAYRKNFIRIFRPNASDPDRINIDLNATETVLESFRVLCDKVDKVRNRRVVYAGLLTTAITIFISLSIVFQNHFGLDRTPVSTKLIIASAISFMAFELLHHLYFGKTFLLVNPKPHAKELYQRIYIAGHDKTAFQKFALRYKILYGFLKYGIFVIGAVAGFFLYHSFLRLLSHS